MPVSNQPPHLPENLSEMEPRYRAAVTDPDNQFLGRRPQNPEIPVVEVPQLPAEVNGHFELHQLRTILQKIRFENLQFYNNLLAFERSRNHQLNLLYSQLWTRLATIEREAAEERHRAEMRHRNLCSLLSHLLRHSHKILAKTEEADIQPNRPDAPKGPGPDSDENGSTPPKRILRSHTEQ